MRWLHSLWQTIRPRSIRVRLTLTYTLLLTGVFALFCIGLFAALNNVIYNNFYSQVTAAADKVVKDSKVVPYFTATYSLAFRVESETIGGDSTTSIIKTGFFNTNGQVIPGNQRADPKLGSTAKPLIDKAVATNSRQSTTVSDKSGDTSVLAVPVPVSTNAAPYVLLVQSSLQSVEQEITLLQRILIASALAMTLLSAGGAWFLTGRVLQPIGQITEKVRKITAQDLSQRLNIPAHDEIGRMAATFDDMIERLHASFERQRRFTSDASHELRTPLAVMQADLSLALRRPRTAPEYRATLESAQEEVGRLSHMVNDLLMLARLDTDAAQIAHEPVQLDELLDMVVSGLRPLATERRIALTYIMGAPVVMLGDQVRLKQVFLNLLDNALSYTPEGGSVSVTLFTDATTAEVTVRDTGIGIPEEDLPHVFERFYRAEEARIRNHEGSGLGLAIVQRVVQAHQGRIEVASARGIGTTFQIFLPLQGPLAGQGSTGRLHPLSLLAAVTPLGAQAKNAAAASAAQSTSTV